MLVLPMQMEECHSDELTNWVTGFIWDECDARCLSCACVGLGMCCELACHLGMGSGMCFPHYWSNMCRLLMFLGELCAVGLLVPVVHSAWAIGGGWWDWFDPGNTCWWLMLPNWLTWLSFIIAALIVEICPNTLECRFWQTKSTASLPGQVFC